MPVFSYLAYPVKGLKNKLIQDLKSMNYCEVVPADNKDVVILVTDTPDDEQEKLLQRKLKKINSLQSLGMTFGHTAE